MATKFFQTFKLAVLKQYFSRTSIWAIAALNNSTFQFLLQVCYLIARVANCLEFALEANVQTAGDCQVAVKLVCIKMPIRKIRRVS